MAQIVVRSESIPQKDQLRPVHRKTRITNFECENCCEKTNRTYILSKPAVPVDEVEDSHFTAID